MTYKPIIFFSLILNVLVLIGGAINYYYVVIPLYDGMEIKLGENTSSLAIKSSNIIQAYSEKEKVENIDKIIFLYEKIVAYLEPLEKFMFEATETISYYSYIFLFVSIINIVLISLLLRNKVFQEY